MSGLAVSGTSAESISLSAPSSAGTYYYGACVVTVSGENDTRNNCSTAVRVTVEASAPDLVVQSASLSVSTLGVGESFTLNATVRNQGAGQSASTTLRYYRSSNATISTRDTQVGTGEVSRLAPSGTSAESISLSAPSSAGTYYYGACVESVSGESNTRNNCSKGVDIAVKDDASTPEEARERLKERGIPYSRASFHAYADSGNLEIVKLFVVAGMDVNVEDDQGLSALLFAARRGPMELVQLLVDNGAEAIARAINWAAIGGHLEIMLYLFENGTGVISPSSFSYSLPWAAYGGHLEVVRYLVENGHAARRTGLNKYGDEALRMAAGEGHLEVVQFLIKEGFEINPHYPGFSRSKRGDAPLIICRIWRSLGSSTIFSRKWSRYPFSNRSSDPEPDGVLWRYESSLLVRAIFILRLFK